MSYSIGICFFFHRSSFNIDNLLAEKDFQLRVFSYEALNYSQTNIQSFIDYVAHLHPFTVDGKQQMVHVIINLRP